MAAATEALMPRSLHRARTGGLRVRARQPCAEIVRRFVRRAPVKRHQRGRHAGDPDDVGTPSIRGNRRDLDEIGSSTNGFFEAMDGRGHNIGERAGCLGTLRIVRRFARRSSEAIRENARTDGRERFSRRERPKEIFPPTVPQQEIHRSSTGFPQLRSFALS